jgi:hypothetical protein
MNKKRPVSARELLGTDHVVVFFRLDEQGQVMETRVVGELPKTKAESYLFDMGFGRGFVLGTKAYAPGYWQRVELFTSAEFAEDVRRNLGPF